jgi:Zn-finger nucleic acid-binding protein
MKCPRCGSVTGSEAYEGVELEKCPGCQGVWIPGSRLAQIIEIREKTFSIEEIAAFREIHDTHEGVVHPADSPISCPECGTPMQQSRYNYAHEVIIDRCPGGHGIWLDRGELEHVQMAVEEEEGELQQLVAEKGLKMDRFASERLEHEQNQYRFNPWYFFIWRK